MNDQKAQGLLPWAFCVSREPIEGRSLHLATLETPKPRPGSLGFGYHEQAVALVGQREALHPVARSLYGESFSVSSWARCLSEAQQCAQKEYAV